MYSVLNTLSEYTNFYISKNNTSETNKDLDGCVTFLNL